MKRKYSYIRALAKDSRPQPGREGKTTAVTSHDYWVPAPLGRLFAACFGRGRFKRGAPIKPQKVLKNLFSGPAFAGAELAVIAADGFASWEGKYASDIVVMLCIIPLGRRKRL